MARRRKTAAVLAALVLALNAGILTAAAEESQVIEFPVLRITSKDFTIIDLDGAEEIPAAFKEIAIAVDEQTVRGWTEESADQLEFCIVYGRMDDGEADFYRYDLTDKTLQRYVVPASSVREEDFQKLTDDYNRLQEDYSSLARENIMFKVTTAAAVLAAMF